MKLTVLLVVVAMVLVTMHGGDAVAEDTTTLTGEYVWTGRNKAGDLEAVFTATGSGTWDVSFHFDFRGQGHVYSGTAEGSLSEGALKGQVQNENNARTFTFSGKFKNGKFQGTHAEVRGDNEQRTGTLTLGG